MKFHITDNKKHLAEWITTTNPQTEEEIEKTKEDLKLVLATVTGRKMSWIECVIEDAKKLNKIINSSDWIIKSS